MWRIIVLHLPRYANDTKFFRGNLSVYPEEAILVANFHHQHSIRMGVLDIDNLTFHWCEFGA